MFQILIKDQKTNNYKPLFIKVEDTETVETQVTDPVSGNVTTVTEEKGLGTYSTVLFETEDMDVLEKKYVELLETHTKADLVPIDNLAHTIDIVWS